MPRLTHRQPAYRLHKRSGHARVCIDGREFWLGPHGSPESKKEYDRLIAEWLANGRSLTPQRSDAGPPAKSLTVVEAIASYWEWARVYYRIDGRSTGEAETIRDALRYVKQLYGHTPAAGFGPVAFKTVRQAMVDAGQARTTVNQRMARVRRWLRWCVENELVPADTLQRVTAVAALRPGAEGTREAEPVGPIAEDQIEAVLPHVSPTIAAMIQLQRLTGMRPGEVIAMTTGQLDRSGDVWIYRPRRHKTYVRGLAREVAIGPKGQAVLATWLKADPAAPLFSPIEAEAARNAERRAARRTPMTPSQAKRQTKAEPKRTPGARFTLAAYRRAIARGCKLAFPHPALAEIRAGALTAEQRSELAAWRKSHRWHPNQLRHSAATQIRREFGLEAAQVILGHARADVTQVYAEADRLKALDVARRVG